jgi:hypothetical protein
LEEKIRQEIIEVRKTALQLIQYALVTTRYITFMAEIRNIYPRLPWLVLQAIS